MVTAISAPKIAFRHVTVRYGARVALDDVTFEVAPHTILGIIGPASSGKTTLLRCLNRMIEVEPTVKVEGDVLLDGASVFRVRNVHDLRRRVGMVLPLPIGLPLSVYENVAFALRVAGLRSRSALDDRVEQCLRLAALWDEVKDRLHELATRLSGGQQQRLALARALSHDPEILCLDEFSIAIDPVTTMKIEDVLTDLRQTMTIVVATNLVQQAHRLADRVAFLNDGRLIEVGSTDWMFSEHPSEHLTFDYVRGNVG